MDARPRRSRSTGVRSMPPPNHHDVGAGARRGVRDEHAHVHVHGRRVRIARMQHQRHAHRLPRAPGELRPLRGRRRRQAVAADVRKLHAAALEARGRPRSTARCRRRLRAASTRRAETARRRSPRARATMRRLQADEVIARMPPSTGRVAARLAGGPRPSARWPMSVRYCMPSKWMLGDGGVGGALRLAHRVAERGDAQHAPAADHDVAVRRCACRRGTPCTSGCASARHAIEAVDHVAAARRVGIAGRGEHDAERRAPVPLGLDAIERAVDARARRARRGRTSAAS